MNETSRLSQVIKEANESVNDFAEGLITKEELEEKVLQSLILAFELGSSGK